MFQAASYKHIQSHLQGSLPFVRLSHSHENLETHKVNCREKVLGQSSENFWWIGWIGRLYLRFEFVERETNKILPKTWHPLFKAAVYPKLQLGISPKFLHFYEFLRKNFLPIYLS